MLKIPGLEWPVTEMTWKPAEESRFGFGLKQID